MFDLVASLTIFAFGVVVFWLFSVFWKILKADPAIYDRNRRNVGAFRQNIIGRNPVTHDSHAQSHGRVFVPEDSQVTDFSELPKGQFVDNAKISSDYIDDIIVPR